MNFSQPVASNFGYLVPPPPTTMYLTPIDVRQRAFVPPISYPQQVPYFPPNQPRPTAEPFIRVPTVVLNHRNPHVMSLTGLPFLLPTPQPFNPGNDDQSRSPRLSRRTGVNRTRNRYRFYRYSYRNGRRARTFFTSPLDELLPQILMELAELEDDVSNFGLTESELSRIPTKKWTKAGESDKCMICLETYSGDSVLRELRCQHDFHADCVDIWLKRNATCPLCRTQIKAFATNGDSCPIQ
ncbi:cytochrome c oxidase subunit 1 [Cichlidogyrus casuarinus]|uniref:Cytochrome c oxidase subunit 1 n=1 Tax=Cichlidogyrus casuarinus TaxID=1844966 RepID=A0ABD2QMG8_9PLAT